MPVDGCLNSDSLILSLCCGADTDWGVKACHRPFVGSWGHYAGDAETFSKWQVDYVKFDGCLAPGGPGGSRWNSSDWDSPAAGDFFAGLAANMSGALEKTGRDMWLNYHCWASPPGDERCAEYGNSFRVYDDHQGKEQFSMLLRRHHHRIPCHHHYHHPSL